MQAKNFKQSYFLDENEVELIVKAFVSEFFFVDLKDIFNETRFEEDLCADLFVLADCIDALEEEFSERAIGFRIEDSERKEIETVGSLIEAISAHVVTLSERNET